MADISSSLRAWSATASSNAPAGTTAIGVNLDDNLREIQAVVRGYLAGARADMASASTVDLSTATSNYINITGTTTITAFGTESSGIQVLLKFAGALTLTHNATSLILPGAANITTAAGDMALMVSEGSGNWRCAWFRRARGNDFVNVKDFGAVGDGVTNDTTAIQAAITYAQLSNLTVVFPSGTYLSGQVNVAAACSLVGPATIQMTGSDATAYQWCKFTTSFTGFLASDLTIIGDNVEANSHYGFGPTSSAIVVSRAEFRNIRFYNGIVGIDATAMNDVNIIGGKIGPIVGTSSGRGYGIAGGTDSKNIRVSGVHFYRTSRHGCYLGATVGASVTNCTFEEHGYGATPSQLSALVLSRGKGQTAIGNSFINCVHNPAEVADTNTVSGQFEAWVFSGNVISGCKRPLIVGDANATVSSNASTVAGSITGNSWHMPVSSDGDCIKVYQARALSITGNTFYWVGDTAGQTCITIDDVATDYPDAVLIASNCAYLNTASSNSCLVYIDTNTAISSSAAAIEIKANSVFGGGTAKLFESSGTLQNSNIRTDSLVEQAISGATPYITGYSRFVLSQGGATNVTNFLGGYEGQRISIRFSDGNSTLTNAMYLAGAVNFTGTTHDQIVLERTSSTWREISRSVN